MNTTYSLGKEKKCHRLTLVDYSLRLPDKNVKKQRRGISCRREQRAVRAISPSPQRPEVEQRTLCSKQQSSRDVAHTHRQSVSPSAPRRLKRIHFCSRAQERCDEARRYVEACEESQRTTIQFDELRRRRILQFHLDQLQRYDVSHRSDEENAHSDPGDRGGKTSADGEVEARQQEEYQTDTPQGGNPHTTGSDASPSDGGRVNGCQDRNVCPQTAHAAFRREVPLDKQRDEEEREQLRGVLIQQLIEDALTGTSDEEESVLHPAEKRIHETQGAKGKGVATTLCCYGKEEPRPEEAGVENDYECLSLPPDISFGTPANGSVVPPSPAVSTVDPDAMGCGCHDTAALRSCRGRYLEGVLDEMMNIYIASAQHHAAACSTTEVSVHASQSTNRSSVEGKPEQSATAIGSLNRAAAPETTPDTFAQPQKCMREQRKEDEEPPGCLC
eukprot:gene1865-1143_t